MIKQRILPVFLTFFASFATLAASFEEITVSGTLFPIARTTICSQVSARMQELFVGTGDRVEKGQALARLDPVMIELDAKQLEIASKLATITLEEAQENYARMKNLYEKENEGHSSIPKKAFDEAKNQLKKSELLWQQAQVNLQRGNERLNETQIRAPYSGVITKCFLSLGDSVSVAPATPIFEMIDETKVVFEFSLPIHPPRPCGFRELGPDCQNLWPFGLARYCRMQAWCEPPNLPWPPCAWR